MKNVTTKRVYHLPLAGDALKSAIASAVDHTPIISDATKRRIKGCGGCTRRAEKMNAFHREARKLFASVSDFIHKQSAP
jgi:hypothetical protein